MSSPELTSLLIAIVGCFVGLAGWLSGRDKKISNDAEWKGTVNAKLDMVLGFGTDLDELDGTVKKHGERITAVESSAASAHHRLDAIEKGRG